MLVVLAPDRRVRRQGRGPAPGDNMIRHACLVRAGCVKPDFRAFHQITPPPFGLPEFPHHAIIIHVFANLVYGRKVTLPVKYGQLTKFRVFQEVPVSAFQSRVQSIVSDPTLSLVVRMIDLAVASTGFTP